MVDFERQLFDGFIGVIQRNESDIFVQFVRPDSTPFEPGHFLTFAEIDDSPRIYSIRRESKEIIVIDIMYLWTNFGVETWFYLLISLILCSFVFILISVIKENYPISSLIRSAAKLLLNSFWNYFTLFVDMAATKVLPSKSAIVLWTSVVIAIFYAIHIVLMGTLSTDLTVPVTLPSIESLSDLLYDPEFNSTQPVIFRQMNMYSVLKHSRVGTDERALFEKIASNENVSVKEIGMTNHELGFSTVMDLIEQTVRGKVAIIENSNFINPAIINGFCFLNPDMINNLKAADDVISQSILSLLVSKRTPVGVRELLQFRMMASAEAGLVKGTSQNYGKSALSTIGRVQSSTKGMICGEKFQHTFWAELDLPWEIFELTPFRRLIRICFGLISFALIVLFMERFFFELPAHKNKINIRVINTYREQ